MIHSAREDLAELFGCGASGGCCVSPQPKAARGFKCSSQTRPPTQALNTGHPWWRPVWQYLRDDVGLAGRVGGIPTVTIDETQGNRFQHLGLRDRAFDAQDWLLGEKDG